MKRTVWCIETILTMGLSMQYTYY